MSWEIITKTQASEFIRIPESKLDDIWYDITIGLIESHTGWEDLDAEIGPVTSTFSGDGSSYIPLKTPLKSVDSIRTVGVLLPTAYYTVAWDGVYMNTYRPLNVVIQQSVYYDTYSQYGTIFPVGQNNISVTYTHGGYLNLPKNLRNSLKAAALMILREFTVYPRNEGSDQIMKVYKAGLHTDEALKKAGTHGKILGILEDFMPPRNRFA